MPELPDLTLFSENLTRRLSGQCVVGTTVLSTKSLKGNIREFQSSVMSKKLCNVSRNGKELVFNLAEGIVFSIHLMLKGYLSLGQIADSKPKVIVEFSEDTLSLRDPMSWAKVTFPHIPSTVPDPLSHEFTISYLTKQLNANAKVPLKTFLITQSEILGIGNAYADEIMWAARIAPQSLCGALPAAAIVELHDKSRYVIKWAIEELKKRTPDAISGEDRSFLVVHKKDVPTTPFGVDIKIEKIGNKSTYFTDEQRLYR